MGYERAVGGSDEYHYWDQYNPYSSGASYKYQHLTRRVNFANELYARYSAYGTITSSLPPFMEEKAAGEVVNYAMQFVRQQICIWWIQPYKWHRLFRIHYGGISAIWHFLPHSQRSTEEGCGQAISTSDPSQWMAGDILCYNGHVVLYLGNTQPFTITDTQGGTIEVKPYSVVHASNSKPYPAGGIKISGTGDPNYWKTYHDGLVAVRRVLSQ